MERCLAESARMRGIDVSSGLVILSTAFAALVAFFIIFGLRTPPEYGAGEIARGPDNPTVTTIARNDLIARRFFENGVQVAKATYWGLGDKGIALSLKGDPTEYLLTSDGNWFEDTRHRPKTDIRLMLLAGGTQMVTADRITDTLGGWKKGEDGKLSRVYVIDSPQGRFDLVRLKRFKFALHRGGSVLGIAAMPLPGSGGSNRLKTRIELPASLPLATRLFVALLVEIEDIDQ
jgi:hypothetical protein